MVCGMNPLYKTENNVVHSSSPSPQNYKNAVKPPIAIKPIFNAILHSDLGHLNNTQSSLRQKLPPMPPPRSRKRTVPPGDYERQFSMADFKGLERELELARYENKEEHSQNLPKSGVSGHVVNLPTLTKCTKNHIFLPKSEFIHSTTQPYINRIPNKFQSPRDKNALLIEKVRGSSAPCVGYQQDLPFTSYQQNKQLETLPLHQESNLSASLRSSLSPPCTTNSTLIISVNNSNNNVNKNNNMLREDYNLKPIVKDSIVDISTEPNIRLSDILLLPFSETANPPSSILKASTLTTTAISTPIVITSSVTNSGSYRVHSTCPATTTASKMCSCSNSTCLEHNEEQVLKKKRF
ncbi:unnamed protein product [Meganyctiphanes norvegica]|uniref:Uncharacterized protein n=1 Tax=Meganyctiphanes norvegica TaxID=48144 RepID=A0AAV2SC49_MEGNR